MRVVTIGAHIVDVLARPVDRLPAGQDSVIVEQVRMTAAGSAAGTAVDLAKLGAEVVSIGAVGDDELADFLVMVMSRHGVDVTHLVRRSAVQTSASILPIRPDGGRPSFHAPGASPTFTVDDVPPAALTGAHAIHVGAPDVMPGLVGERFGALLDGSRARGAVVTMDLLSNVAALLRRATELLAHVDYVLPNEEQALAMTGAGSVDEAAADLLRRGPSGVVVTLGGDGCLVATGEGTLRLPALDIDVVDTTGCGDAFCAGFVVGLLYGKPVPEAARWGTAAAARVAGGLGSDAGITDLASTVAGL